MSPVHHEDLSLGLKDAMRRLASAVAVVSARSRDGGAVGMAATSVTSLSMSPPSLLVCINRQTGIHASMFIGARFNVNLLGNQHRDVAAAFGGQVARELRFGVGQWADDIQGLPALADAQAVVGCEVDRLVTYGTHTIVVGAVREVRVAGEVQPLIYQDGRYL
jgi:flavin reductase (DIM6/NTAB) family NADH-FMN oxidoreductase RutF